MLAAPSSNPPRLHLPAPNPFIPTDLSLASAEAFSAPPHPVPLVQLPGRLRLWHKPDVRFGQPKAVLYLDVHCPEAYGSPRAAVCTRYGTGSCAGLYGGGLGHERWTVLMFGQLGMLLWVFCFGGRRAMWLKQGKDYELQPQHQESLLVPDCQCQHGTRAASAAMFRSHHGKCAAGHAYCVTDYPESTAGCSTAAATRG